MSTPFQPIFLRRTLAALMAVAGFAAAPDVLAQGRVTLKTGTGDVFCDFSSMSITPNGSVTVQCANSPPPVDPNPLDPALPGQFVMAVASSSAPAESVANVTVNRTLGGLAYTLYYWLSGSGCAHDGGVAGVNFAQGAGSAIIQVQLAGTVGAKCSVNLGEPPAPAALGAQRSTEVTLTQGSTQPPPPPPVNGCPAVPQDMLTANLGGRGNHLYQLQKSGQVVSMKLPSTAPKLSGQIYISESSGTYSPQPVTIEMSINKCPGVIDTNTANACNMRSTNGYINAITWLSGNLGGLNEAAASAFGYCWAGEPGAEYYINARWSYQSCPHGQPICGFQMEYSNALD
ncbi:MAG TPA: hypothetical protein VEC19_00145 [Usitatibacter sp.]|nr:hypothetical protein [Usitatibacter sp.]